IRVSQYETQATMRRATTRKTLSEKVWDRHVVHRAEGEPDVLYIDLHLVHEVTSPQAFDGLRMTDRTVRRPDLTVATMDHNVPTVGLDKPLADPISAKQMDVLRKNCEEFGIRLYPMGDPGQGIVHVIGPEQGLTQPGMTIVCGASHTSTNGAFGDLAFGHGTSEDEHVLATADTTFAYLEGRPHSPSGAAWEQALDRWRSLATDDDAVFDREVLIDAASLQPHVSWGTNPSQVVTIDGAVPEPASEADER